MIPMICKSDVGWFCHCDSVGTNIVVLSRGLVLLNIPTSFFSADVRVSPTVTSGLAGAGFCRPQIKSCAAWMSASVEDIFGMLNSLGKNPTVSAILSVLFLVLYILCCL